MKQTKKWLAVLLCAVLLAGALPMGAFADAGTGTTGETPTRTALTTKGGTLSAGSYVLNGNITLTADLVISGEVTLDLMGYTLSGTGRTSVITVNSGGTLTLQDTGSGSTGKVTGGHASTNDDQTKDSLYGGGVTVNSGGTFHLMGGSITENNDGGHNQATGGVCVKSGGTFTMSGGSITGNTGRGLALGVDLGDSNTEGATGTIRGGTISNNNVGNDQNYGSKGGGGVYVTMGSTCTMTGGTISDNTAENTGGGVCIYGAPS